MVSRSPRRSASAFTILEIVLALAVIALFGTILIGASARLLKSRATTPDEVFWKACQAARKGALTSNGDVRLGYDDKAKAFIVGNGIVTQTFPVPGADRELEISFLAAQSGGSAILLGGTLVETTTHPFVTFYADGTCTPFRLQVHLSGGVHVLAIDPWTCAPVLETPKNT